MEKLQLTHIEEAGSEITGTQHKANRKTVECFIKEVKPTNTNQVILV